MTEDPAAVALTVVDLARQERFADIEALFTPPLREAVSTGTLRTAWAAETSRIGTAWTVEAPRAEPAGPGLTRVHVPVTGEHGAHTVVLAVDSAGRVHGLRIAPPDAEVWQPPGYANPGSFTEHDVTVGEGPLAVPGTVSLPRRGGPWPAVVLLAGGGSFDRDQSIGPNKPLKDLAWGLASRGIAVARFDKVTHTHPHVASAPGFTMADEYLPHARAAVALLRQQHGVDADRVYLLGHSAGGRTAPRVAAADGTVAGLIIMAGDAAPLTEAAIRVARHLTTVVPGPAGEAVAETLARQVAVAADPDLAPATPAADLPFGLPASYWLDLRGYDQVATAAALSKPTLILQGGRDYQVTVADDLSRWQAGLAHHPDVTVRVYDGDDHLFFPGTGPSRPSDAERAQHVDAAVVADIAAWLRQRR